METRGSTAIGLVVISQVQCHDGRMFPYDDEENYYLSLGNKGYLETAAKEWGSEWRGRQPHRCEKEQNSQTDSTQQGTSYIQDVPLKLLPNQEGKPLSSELAVLQVLTLLVILSC